MAEFLDHKEHMTIKTEIDQIMTLISYVNDLGYMLRSAEVDQDHKDVMEIKRTTEAVTKELHSRIMEAFYGSLPNTDPRTKLN